MALPKIYDTPEQAIADIPDGATIMTSGFGGAGGRPLNLIAALVDKGVKDITLINHVYGLSMGIPGVVKAVDMLGLHYPAEYEDTWLLFKNGQVKKWIGSVALVYGKLVVGQMRDWVEGRMEIEIVPQGTLAERIRAGSAGIKGFYTTVSAGTSLAEDKETRIIDGEECVLEYPLRADYALIRAYKADKLGNLIYRGTSRSFGPLMATAADATIVEVDEIVEIGELDPEAIVTPGIYVDRMVKVPKPWWPYNYNPL